MSRLCVVTLFILTVCRVHHVKFWLKLDEAQAGIKIARRNINNLRYAANTTRMAESEEELKSLLMKVKEESEKAQHSKNEDHGIQSHHLMASESESEVAQLCPTLCDPVDCSLPGFSVHGIL